MRRARGTSLALSVALLGCSGEPSSASSQIAPSVADVIYLGGTTDEALLRLLDGAPQDIDAQRIVIDAPGAGAALSRDAPATIAFHRPNGASLERVRGSRARVPSLELALGRLIEGLRPERDAFAHGAPFNGTGFFLVVSDAAGEAKLRVFTAQTRYTPDAARWGDLAADRQPLTLRVTLAEFDENNIPEGGGPFVGGSLTFSVQ